MSKRKKEMQTIACKMRPQVKKETYESPRKQHQLKESILIGSHIMRKTKTRMKTTLFEKA